MEELHKVPPSTELRGKACPYYPCHNLVDMDCEYCYCPLYFVSYCGGNFKILPNGIKDCSQCDRPHTPAGKLKVQSLMK